jgi:hypothetical protein
VSVERERARHAAAQRLVHHEIQRTDAGQLIALDRSADDVGEVGLHPLSGHVLGEKRVVAGLVGDHRDVRHVSLVAAAGMGKLAELHPQATS